MKKIVILGAGPCGLGAAWRLNELNHKFKIFEKNSYPGGLSASFLDNKGFTWDIGGHVIFSHYEYFDKVIEKILKKDFIDHIRASHIRLKNRFIPYPFQNNIRYLNKIDILKSVIGLLNNKKINPKNFKEWIQACFGKGIANLFMYPYNFKVWTFPLDKMDYKWIGERVSVINKKDTLKNIILKKKDDTFGPNKTFKFPIKGGTGEIWGRISDTIEIKNKINFNTELIKINTKKRTLIFNNKQKEKYDFLISTMPLNYLIKISDINTEINLESNSVHVLGMGFKGKIPRILKDKNWMYFPSKKSPFYRVTVFSNYSPKNVPENHWSLMAEVSESRFRKINKQKIKNQIIQGLINEKLINHEHKKNITNTWYNFQEKNYPIPSLERDGYLKILSSLKKLNIFSRGRFGAWKYEIGNQDHSFMQGVEAVNKILLNREETTLNFPGKINTSKKVPLKCHI